MLFTRSGIRRALLHEQNYYEQADDICCENVHSQLNPVKMKSCNMWNPLYEPNLPVKHEARYIKKTDPRLCLAKRGDIVFRLVSEEGKKLSGVYCCFNNLRSEWKHYSVFFVGICADDQSEYLGYSSETYPTTSMIVRTSDFKFLAKNHSNQLFQGSSPIRLSSPTSSKLLMNAERLTPIVLTERCNVETDAMEKIKLIDHSRYIHGDKETIRKALSKSPTAFGVSIDGIPPGEYGSVYVPPEKLSA